MVPVGTILNLDVWTLIRKGVARTLTGLHSTLPLFMALAALLASAVTACLQLFGPRWVPIPSEFVESLDWINGDLASLVMYSLDASTLLLILDGTFSFIEALVPFCITWIVAFSALQWAMSAKSAVRKQIKDFLER